MTLDEILKQLTYPPKELPREALRAADQYRAELTPRLLASLADLSIHPELLDKDPENQLPFIAMYLLAVWREPQAHPLLIKFLRLPGDLAIDLSGEMVSQDMLWMLVQTCAGDTSQIEALVFDRKAGGWSRGIAVNALTLFTQQGGQSKEALGEQFRRIIEKLREYDSENELVDSTPLSEVAFGVLDLQLVSLRMDVLMLFDAGRINEESITREEFEKAFGSEVTFPGRAPVTDVVKALSWWDFDSNMSPPPKPLMELDKYEDAVNAFVERTDIRIEETVKRIAQQRGELVPYRAPAKLGRNDPCSCGSGKKYKKCCGV